MRAMMLRLVLPAILLLPAVASAQKSEGGTGLSPGQWRHWAVKTGAGAVTYQALNELRVSPELSAIIATTAPTVLGKLLYAPKGLGEDPQRRWPSAGFVVKDVAGELCVQSAPLWLRFAVSGPKDERVIRSLVAAGAYGIAIFGCARRLEVR